MDELINRWRAAGKSLPGVKDTPVDIRSEANRRKKDVLKMHLGTIAILLGTFCFLCWFFYSIAPFKMLISRIGVGMMLIGLLIRIIVEINSLTKVSVIRFDGDSASAAGSAAIFFNYRQKIHGQLTIVVVVGYITGFYLLTPEFSHYIPKAALVAMDAGFVIIAIVMIIQLRKVVKREMENVRSMTSIFNDLHES